MADFLLSSEPEATLRFELEAGTMDASSAIMDERLLDRYKGEA